MVILIISTSENFEEAPPLEIARRVLLLSAAQVQEVAESTVERSTACEPCGAAPPGSGHLRWRKDVVISADFSSKGILRITPADLVRALRNRRGCVTARGAAPRPGPRGDDG